MKTVQLFIFLLTASVVAVNGEGSSRSPRSKGNPGINATRVPSTNSNRILNGITRPSLSTVRESGLDKVKKALGGTLSKSMEGFVAGMSPSAQTTFSKVCKEMKSVTEKFKPSPGSPTPKDPCQDKAKFKKMMENQDIATDEQFEVMMASMDNKTKNVLMKVKKFPAFNTSNPPKGFRGKDYYEMAKKLTHLSPRLQSLLNSSDINSVDVNKLNSSEIEKLAPFIPMMTPKTIKSLGSAMSSAVREKTCKANLEYEQKAGGGKGVSRMAENGLNCIDAMAKNPNLTTGAQKKGLVTGMKKKSPSTWSSNEFKQVMNLGEGAMDDEIMKEFPDEDFNEMWLSGTGPINKATTSRQSNRVKRQMALKAKSACGSNVAQWNDTCLQKGAEAGILDGLSPSEFKGMDARKLIDLGLLNQMNPSTSGKPDVRTEISKRLVRKGLDSRNFNATDIGKTADVWMDDPNMLKNIPNSALIDSLNEIKGKVSKMNPAMKGRMLRKLQTSKNFAPVNMTSEDLENIGSLLSEMPGSDIDKIPDAEMKAAFDKGSFKNVSFKNEDKVNMRKMMKKYKDAANFDPCSMSSTSAKNFGTLLSVLSTDELSCLPNDIFANTEAVSSLGKAAKLMDKRQKSSLAKTMITKGQNTFTNLGSEEIAGALPFAVLLENSGKLGLNASATFPYNNLPKEQYMYFCEEMKKSLGNMSETSTNWTGESVAKFPCIMAFCSSSDTQNLSTNSIMGIAEQVSRCPQTRDMSDTQVKAIGNKCMQYLSLTNMSTLTGTDVTPCAQFLRHRNTSEDFRGMNASTMASMIEETGKGHTDDMSRAKLKEWAATSLNYTNRDSTQAPANRSAVSTLDDLDLSQMGNFVCGLGKTELGKLNENAILMQGPTIRDNCPLSSDESKAFVDGIKKTIQNWKSRSEVLSIMAPFAEHLTDTELSEIDANELAVATFSMATNFDARDNAIKRREERGHKDMTSTEKANQKSGQSRILKRGFNALRSYQARRRKRSTTAVTCTDAKAMESRVTATLTDSDISGMASSEFISCTSFFGLQTTWSSSQISVLLTKAKSVYSSTTSSWTSETVTALGVINSGLTVSEIQSLNLTLDGLSNIGVSPLLSAEQLVAGISRYLAYPSTKALSSLTEVELMGMKEFFCGLTDKQISNLSSSSVSRALPVIGTLTKCSVSQMSKVWARVKVSMGSVSNGWSAALISEMRNVIMGVPGSDLKTFTTQQVAAIPATSIPLIEPVNFKELSTTQLQAMSSAQGNMLTTAQKQSLNVSQQTAINSVTGSTVVFTGATKISPTLYGFVIAIMAIQYLNGNLF